VKKSAMDRSSARVSSPSPGAFGFLKAGGWQERRVMTVKTNGRSHRVIYLLVLLVFAVALTTALVLAGELKPEGSKSSTLLRKTVPTLRASVWGTSNA